MPKSNRLVGCSDWPELGFVEREAAPKPAMKLGIQLHLAGLSLSDTVSVLEEFEESFPELSLKSRPLAEVLEDFRTDKLAAVSSEKQYSRKIDYIETYLLEALELETTEELASEDVERYSEWRKYESLDREKPLGTTTLQDDLYLFREFIEYLIKNQLAPRRFEWSVEIPETDSKKDGVDEKRLTPERAKTVLECLRKYHYADVDHVAMELFCQSGPRKSGVCLSWYS